MENASGEEETQISEVFRVFPVVVSNLTYGVNEDTKLNKSTNTIFIMFKFIL